MAARPAQGSTTATRLIVGRRPFAPRAGDIRSCPVIVRRLSFHRERDVPRQNLVAPDRRRGRDAP